jgi:hypothetical protein
LEHLSCLRCNRELETGHKSVGVFMFAQTVGIRPRQKSAARRICFCSPCSVSLAMGPAPEGALNIAAWQMIRDLVGADPALNQAAWDTLRGIVGLLPTSEAGVDSAGQPVNPATPSPRYIRGFSDSGSEAFPYAPAAISSVSTTSARTFLSRPSGTPVVTPENPRVNPSGPPASKTPGIVVTTTA